MRREERKEPSSPFSRTLNLHLDHYFVGRLGSRRWNDDAENLKQQGRVGQRYYTLVWRLWSFYSSGSSADRLKMLFIDFCVSIYVVSAALHINRDTESRGFNFVGLVHMYVGILCSLVFCLFCLTSFVCNNCLCDCISSKNCRKIASMTQIVLVWTLPAGLSTCVQINLHLLSCYTEDETR